MTIENQKNLTHLTKSQLEKELTDSGEQAFRAKQIWNWIYARGVKSFAEMTNISKERREILSQNFSKSHSRIPSE